MLRHALVAVSAAIALAIALPTTAPAGTGAKGPVGWDTYRQLDRIGELARGTSTQQFSSFDRTGGNWSDGFDGRFSCLRQADDGCVIAERTGAGEVQSIWFTRDDGDVSRTGNIKIELDGRTVLDAPLADVVNGKAGAPFAFPLVANADQSSGGVYIKVPMPYRSSMRVTTTNNPLFYHVSNRRFADARGVDTFDPSDRATDVLATLRDAGLRDPKRPARRARRTQRQLRLAPGATAELARLRGRGTISELALRLPQLVGPTAGIATTDDGRAFGKGGASQFTMRIDPDNNGVVLTRRYAPNVGNQRARILVDGVPVAEWEPRPVASKPSWRKQRVELPASVTAGKEKITIRNEFVSADVDFNEFYYWVDSVGDGGTKQTDTLDVGQLSTDDEKAHDYTIEGQVWQGYDANHDLDADDDRAAIAASDAILRDARIRITFDGKRTVDAPLGEFFGSGLGEYEVRSLMFAIDPDGWYRAWWPMSYRKAAKVELYNGSSKAITTGDARITSSRAFNKRSRTFNATSRRGMPAPGRDWLFLDQSGSGKFVGVSHTIEGERSEGNRRGYLEGDERVYVDGSRSPQLHGTGSEDFYQGGWYFNRGTFSLPTNGNTAFENGDYGCKQMCDSVYRLMVGDAVPFASDMRFGIEPGPFSDERGIYGSTAYWYGNAALELQRTDVLDVGDRASERAHAYRGGGEVTQLTSVFEGDDDESPVTDEGRATNDPVRFRLRVDDDNNGVVLRRRSDQNVGYQAVEVLVDGKRAGVWRQPLRNEFQRWLEDEFELPADLTEDKDELRIELRPVNGAPAWNAARYVAMSRVAPFSDRRAPSAVRGLRSESEVGTSVRLSWRESDDNVGVARYEVYGSTDPNFTAGPATLLGSSRAAGYRHEAGLKEKWYFRVRAVDSAGNLGPLSEPVAGSTGSTLVIEGERLLPPVAGDAPTEAQGSCCGISWSGGAQLWMRPTAAGRFVTVEFDVPRAGTFDAGAVLTRAPDYGIVDLELDGSPLGAPFDGYDTKVSTATLRFGQLKLAAGKHRLTLRVDRKNPAASKYLAGLDVLKLELVGD